VSSEGFPYTARQARWWFATHGEGSAPSLGDIATLYKVTRKPKTAKEAEDWAREHLGVDAEYGGRVSAESAHEVNMALAEAKSRGVQMPKRVQIATSKSRNVAVYSASNDLISVDPKWREMTASAKAGYFSTDDPAHTIHHEIGHMVHSRAVGERYDSIKNAQIPGAISDEVSRYGKHNGLEFVAEVYAGLFAGKKYSESVMRVYDLYGGVRP